MNNRIIKVSDCQNGRMSEWEKKATTKINLNPAFTEEKPWRFVKHLKTTTKIIPWLIQIGEDYIVATQGFVYRKGEIAMFYKSSRRGTFDVTNGGIAEYYGYLDLESAVDHFYKEQYEPMIALETNTIENEVTKEEEN